MEINDPRIESYFNYELNAEDSKSFLEEAKKHPEIWREIQFRQWVIDGIQDEGKIELKEFISNRLAEEREESTGKFWYAAAAIAITLVVGFGIAWPYLNPSKFNAKSTSSNAMAADSAYAFEPSSTENTPPQRYNSDTSSQTLAVIENNETTDQTIPLTEMKSADVALEEDDIEAEPKSAEPSMSLKSEGEETDAKSNRGYSSSKLRSLPLYQGTDLQAGANALGEELLLITEFQVKPIVASTDLTNSKVAVASSAKVGKSKTSATTNKTPSNYKPKTNSSTSVLSDTVVSEKSGESNRTIARKSAIAEEKFTLVLSRSSSGKPSGFTNKTSIGTVTQYTLILNNFGDLNALLYRLGNSYYLGAGNQYYQVNMQAGSTWQPKQVTDKSILQQLNQ